MVQKKDACVKKQCRKFVEINVQISVVTVFPVWRHHCDRFILPPLDRFNIKQRKFRVLVMVISSFLVSYTNYFTKWILKKPVTTASRLVRQRPKRIQYNPSMTAKFWKLLRFAYYPTSFYIKKALMNSPKSFSMFCDEKTWENGQKTAILHCFSQYTCTGLTLLCIDRK